MPRATEKATLRKDGRYQCKYKGKCFYGDTASEALRARAEYRARDLLQIQSLRQQKTVEAYAGEWLSLHKSGVSVKCYNDYAKQLDALLAVCGSKALKDVRPDDAARVWLHFEGYSASTIKRAAQIYRALFDSAVENDYCAKNPFRSHSVAVPKGTSGTHRALTPEETELIRTTPHRMQTAVMVMLYAGLRRGEVLALTGKDIDLAAGVIHVTKAVRYLSNQPILDTPKTDAGTRDVPILSPLRPFLLKARGVIAPSASGKIMSDTAFTRAWNSYLHALSVAAGHRVEIRTHDLRHTYCTMLCDAGIPMRQAMEWLGHADEKMILRVYDHNTTARRLASVDALEAHLGVKTGVNSHTIPRKRA